MKVMKGGYRKKSVMSAIVNHTSTLEMKSMKTFRILFSLLIIGAAFAAAVQPAKAVQGPGQWYSFTNCTNNSPDDPAIGIAQMVFYVEDLQNGSVRFNFHNTGPLASSLTTVYFQDGLILGPPSIQNGPGVDFDLTAQPANPPGCANFETTVGFNTQAVPPTEPNGVNPSEWLGLSFVLTGNYNDIITQLASGALKIAIHVQGFADGKSESFVNNGPTAITLASFDVKPKRGEVNLNWATGTEISNAGFNLYRSGSENASRVKLNGSLLAAKGDAVSGGSYSFTDKPGTGTFYYWLEDVATSGGSTLHGPIIVTVKPLFISPLYRPVLPGGR